jgi:dTDP-4-amino-4,6-dideoxy-D-glucose acyltransferase
MFDNFFTPRELEKFNFKRIGDNVKISKNSVFYQPEKMCFGDNVRIDDFCKLTGNITLGSYIHIASHSILAGRFGIEIDDFSSISMACILFSATDDFSGEYMINPMVPEEYTNVTGGPIILKKHTIIGAGTIIFPNVVLQEGCAVGAGSIVNRSLDEWKIYGGIPCRAFRNRERKILMLEKELLEKSK